MLRLCLILPKFLLFLVFSFLLLVSYYMAAIVPVSLGWENGAIENTQTALCFLAGTWSLLCCFASVSSRSKGVLLIASTLWFIMVMRELSWGAVFYAPLSVSEVLGPTFSSSQQLWYKPAVAPLLLILLLMCIWIFFKTKQHQTFFELVKRHQLPLVEIGIFSFCMFVATVAEGKTGFGLGLDKGAAQVFEEAAELWGYLALLLAEFRVVRSISR